MKWGAEFVELEKLVHDRHSFDCGKSELNHYIRTEAARHTKAGISKTHILPTAKSARNGMFGICFFYTVVPSSLKQKTLPSDLAKKLPRYPA